MGTFVEDIFKGGAEGLFSGVQKIIGAFKADPTVMAQNAQKVLELEAAAAQAQMQADLQIQLAQAKINEVDAGSEDKFKSYARPAIIWTCGFGLAYSVVFYPFLVWASLNFGWKNPPELDTSILMTMLPTLLGLGAMRSYDKTQGTSK